MTLHDIRRFIIVKAPGGEVRIERTNCFWCGNNNNAICTACHAKAEEVRKRSQDGGGR